MCLTGGCNMYSNTSEFGPGTVLELRETKLHGVVG